MTSCVYFLAGCCYCSIIIINKYELSWIYPPNNNDGHDAEMFDMSAMCEDSNSEAEPERSIYDPSETKSIIQNGSAVTHGTLPNGIQSCSEPNGHAQSHAQPYGLQNHASHE